MIFGRELTKITLNPICDKVKYAYLLWINLYLFGSRTRFENLGVQYQFAFTQILLLSVNSATKRLGTSLTTPSLPLPFPSPFPSPPSPPSS